MVGTRVAVARCPCRASHSVSVRRALRRATPFPKSAESAIFKLIYFAFFGFAALSILRWPALAAGVLLSTYAIEQSIQSRDGFFFQYQSLTNQATALLVMFAVFVRFAKGERTFLPGVREFWLFLAIYGYAAVSTLWSVSPDATALLMRNLPYALAFGLLMPTVVHRAADIRVMLYAVLGVGVILVPLLLFTVDWTYRALVLDEGTAIGSLVGDSGNPLAIASFAGYVCIAGSMLQFRGSGKLLSLARWVLVAMAFVLCMRTASRGQVVAVAVAIFAFLPFAARPRNIGQFVLFLFLGSFVAVVGVVIFKSFLESDAARWQLVGSEGFWQAWSESRASTALILLNYWADAGPFAWIFGVGNGASYAIPGLYFYCHVVMAECLGELGLIGFVMIWLAPIFTFLTLRRLWPYMKDDSLDRGAIMAVGACFLFDVILSFKQGSLFGVENAFAFAIMLGRVLRTCDDERAYYESLENAYYVGEARAETESQFDQQLPSDESNEPESLASPDYALPR